MKYSVHKLLRLSWKIVMAGLVLPFSALTKAEVTLDGTLGPAGSLAGPNFVIPDTVGQTVGTNLFHSFGLFNINTGESATFTGPAAIDNVISRVTGGSQSFIDGLLRSEIESANLWFINPAGVLFGQHASLDIQGSFHVSTADYLKLGDGGRFEATNPENSVLTVAPPEAFGFLGERQPAGIAVQGSRLQVPAGETLSVVGGDIRIADGSLYAPGGRIDMVSVASPGEVLPNAPDLGVASFERLGKIEVFHTSPERPLVDPSLPPEAPHNVIGNVDASGEGGGRIFIRGGEFVADNAFVSADTRGSEEGQGIDIGVTGQVTARNGARITADTFGSGGGGDFTVEAGSLEGLACICVAEGATKRASRLFGAAEALREAVGIEHMPEEDIWREPYLAAARSRLDEASWEEAWAEGRVMSMEQAIEYAFSEKKPLTPSSPESEQPLSERSPSLTRREKEVAILVGRGLTNRQIASELVLSEHTVHHHVTNILRKLKLRSREQISSRLDDK